MAAKQAMKENLQCTSKYGHLRISQDICHVGWQILRASLPYMGIVTICWIQNKNNRMSKKMLVACWHLEMQTKPAFSLSISLKLSCGELHIIPTFWGVNAFHGSQKTCRLRSFMWIGAKRYELAVSICFKYMWRFSRSQKYSGNQSDPEKDNKAIWKQQQMVARPFGWRWALKYKDW